MEMGEGFAFFIAETARPMPDIYIPLSQISGAEDHEPSDCSYHRMGKKQKTPG